MIPSVGWVAALTNKGNNEIDEKQIKWLIIGIFITVIYLLSAGMALIEGRYGLSLQISIIMFSPFMFFDLKSKWYLILRILILVALFSVAGKFDTVKGKCEISYFLYSIGFQNSYYKEEQALSSVRTELKGYVDKKNSGKEVYVSKEFAKKVISLGEHDRFGAKIEVKNIRVLDVPNGKLKLLYAVTDNKGQFRKILFADDDFSY